MLPFQKRRQQFHPQALRHTIRSQPLKPRFFPLGLRHPLSLSFSILRSHPRNQYRLFIRVSLRLAISEFTRQRFCLRFRWEDDELV